MNLHSFTSKTDCTIEYSMSKLSEQSPFEISNINHDDRNKYQIIETFMNNVGKSMKSKFMMKYEKLTFIVIKNRLHH